MTDRLGRVVVVGQGYVGLPLAMRAVEVGYEVVGFDVDRDRIAALSAGLSHVEDVSSSSVGAALANGRYTPTLDPDNCRDFDVAVVTVPTPLRDGLPDLRYIEAAARVIGGHLRPNATAILESTTYPGTTEELFVPILEERSGLKAGADFHVGYSPERIDPGNTTWTLVRTPKVVSGIDGPSLARVRGFYESVVDEVVVVSSPGVAELSKLIENTFRHVNIALVNELAMLANDLGIDVWDAIDAAATKPFGYMKFTPGPGVGGHCLPIDPSYLSWRVRRRLGTPFRFVELANEINEHMPHYVVRRLMVGLNNLGLTVKGSRVLLLGIAYKRNTGDLRESPGLAIAQQLLTLGAEVRVADPFVCDLADPRLCLVEATGPEVAGADVTVLVTDHDAFDYPMIQAEASYVLDTRHRLDGPRVEAL